MPVQVGKDLQERPDDLIMPVWGAWSEYDHPQTAKRLFFWQVSKGMSSQSPLLVNREDAKN